MRGTGRTATKSAGDKGEKDGSWGGGDEEEEEEEEDEEEDEDEDEDEHLLLLVVRVRRLDADQSEDTRTDTSQSADGHTAALRCAAFDRHPCFRQAPGLCHPGVLPPGRVLIARRPHVDRTTRTTPTTPRAPWPTT